LNLSYAIPQIAVTTATPNAFTIRLDYPPQGEAGLGRFLVLYHATEPRPSMNLPYRTYTLIGIRERNR
jgi:hypothetical protein